MGLPLRIAEINTSIFLILHNAQMSEFYYETLFHRFYFMLYFRAVCMLRHQLDIHTQASFVPNL